MGINAVKIFPRFIQNISKLYIILQLSIKL